MRGEGGKEGGEVGRIVRGGQLRGIFLLFVIDPAGAQGQFVVDVLVVFVAVAVGGDEGAGFGVADVLHLVQVVFDADPAQVADGAQDGGHSFLGGSGW